MMKMSCKECADRIVDYLDEELPEDEAQRVAQHLAACDGCRRTAQALERSLGLAQVIWSDNLGGSESAARLTPVRGTHRIRFYAVAASILIAASTLIMIIPDGRQKRVSIRFEEVQQQIVRAGAAAELLAATRILARCEGTEAMVERQHQFILQEYAGTPAAESIRGQYGSRFGGMK
jgi:anti-sigma factor RsiW